MSTDPIVTHADLADLERLRYAVANRLSERALLDRFLARAKADAPELPNKTWVLARVNDGSHLALWHEDGKCWTYDDRTGGSYLIEYFDSDSVKPLRPTVTEAEVKRAVEAAYVSSHPGYRWSEASPVTREKWRRIARDVLAGIDIEVQS